MTDPWPSPQGPSPWAAPDPDARVAPLGPTASAAPATGAATCYRHNGRVAPVSCGRCDKPICTDCMVSAPVGWQCPACAKDGTKVRRLVDVNATTDYRPPVTLTLIGISVLVFLVGLAASGGDLLGNGSAKVVEKLALFGPLVANGDWWRIFTSGFLHFGLMHIGFNMVILWRLGALLERRLGPVRYLALFTAALIGGSAGALLLSPNVVSGGASGAIFGLMGAAFVCRGHGGFRDPIEAGLGGLLVMNLVITFALSHYISVGGHLGGLVVGGLIGLAIRYDKSKHGLLSLGLSVVIGLAAFGGALALAAHPVHLF